MRDSKAVTFTSSVPHLTSFIPNHHLHHITNIDSPVLVAVPLKLNQISWSQEGEEKGCVRPEKVDAGNYEHLHV